MSFNQIINEEEAKSIGLNALEIEKIELLIEEKYLSLQEIEFLVLHGNKNEIERQLERALEQRTHQHNLSDGRVNQYD